MQCNRIEQNGLILHLVLDYTVFFPHGCCVEACSSNSGVEYFVIRCLVPSNNKGDISSFGITYNHAFGTCARRPAHV